MLIVPVEKKIDWRHPPLVLIALVVLNILVFAFYQGGDDEAFFEAVEHYQSNELIEMEWSAYRAYVERGGSSLDIGKNDKETPYYIVSDSGFDRFMAEEGERYIARSKVIRWREARNQLEKISNRISSKSLGFHTDDISVLQSISYQFLHGGVMHLVSNMVFLVLVGFAAEAALGSGVFLVFYLLSGIGSALLYAAMATGSGSLVGASGSISGVMAMYVVLFGMRKIQFFYWVFIFTGYLRAAAIIMLPVYILKEVYSYYSIEGSNVAFTAHIGGFICGAILVWLTKQYRSQIIDENYLDSAPEELDETAVALQRVYDLMGQCEFAKAWEMLKPIKAGNANRADIVELEFNLVRALHPNKQSDYLVHRMDKNGNSESLVNAQLHQWRKFNGEQRSALSHSKRSNLLSSALELSSLDIAEQVFDSLRVEALDAMKLAVMARQIATFCQQSNKPEKATKYNSMAQSLASPSIENS